MADRKVLPYGSWPSPITVDMAVSSSLALREPRFDGDDLYWTEGRPQERGRQVIVRWNERDGAVDVTPADVQRAHHGARIRRRLVRGRATARSISRTSPTGAIYRQPRDGAPVALTAEGPYRYGDLTLIGRATGCCACART